MTTPKTTITSINDEYIKNHHRTVAL
ncbi:hypothetical protein BVI434_960018 [Burkholderia vietnamiensis]|nr:hypothetical protein BVI434_960018 [Burkholderia vietnamiensis]